MSAMSNELVDINGAVTGGDMISWSNSLVSKIPSRDRPRCIEIGQGA